MTMTKILKYSLATLFLLGFAGAGIAANLDESMRFTRAEIDIISSMAPTMSAGGSVAGFDQSMHFTASEIAAISSSRSAERANGIDDSMQFTRAELDAIVPGNGAVACSENC